MGLSYSSQWQMVKELREKDDDFVDALNVSSQLRVCLWSLLTPDLIVLV